ncbi:A24 family peptidase C-terminal domain-containing protein, partial [Halococcus sp. IIIV-5B]|uniref:A24 family peptidase C-terminal domain-containing protein n=1 Tax=Halococcus sp. IIIV-5B TaxID=2321230 RepID=UPI000EEE1F99
VGPVTDGGRAVTHADQWGAAAFLDGLDGDAYGTTPDRLREALDAVVARERLWVSPGIPFLVALFAGLCLALVYGDLLYTVVDALGLL